MKVALVTGGGGFLGTHLVGKLVAEGFKVVVVDNFCTSDLKNKEFLNSFGSEVFVVEADVIQEWSWTQGLPVGWLEALEYVYHFASPASPVLYQKLNIETMWVNTLGLERALQCANRYKAKVIFASTSEIYGDSKTSPQTENDWGNVNSFGARSCYNEAKRFGEALIYSYNQRFNTRHGFVRIFNTYGPRMSPEDGRVIINFLHQALQGKSLSVFGKGHQSRSFCYVDDLIEGIYQYSCADLAEPVNLGNPEEYTILQLAEKIQKLYFDKKLKIEFHELPADDPHQRKPDIQKALAMLPNWKPRVHLAEGLQKMSLWLEERTKS